MTALKMGMTPPHPGIFLYDEVVKPLSLTIEQAAEALGVRQDTLSALLQGQESLAPEMALRFEKVFSVNMEMMLKLQAAYDAAQMRKQAEKLDLSSLLQHPASKSTAGSAILRPY
ncbi:HigA family addiction module antitoxin [Candidatus Thiosymbion oneisti]|uniref:HigA family addiction module antitoxin n=1 Tax=Candidatus Thiosymbion oneisti TaxID=589554 RepID=UPI000A8CA5A5|nr:HigA family addiction module antitoxin [Candidatus Thiosymbion oneisti]